MANKLLVCYPVYHSVPAKFFTRCMSMDRSNEIAFEVVEAVYTPLAMQIIVDEALKENPAWDRLVVIEQDILPPINALTRIAEYTQDIVGSMYFRHEEPHNAVCYIKEKDKVRYNPISQETVKDWCEDPALHRCDAVGFGLTSIKREVLEKWDKKIPMFERNDEFGSHDLWFCHQASKQGFKIYCDTAIVCNHLTETAIGYIHNQGIKQKVKKIKFTKKDNE